MSSIQGAPNDHYMQQKQGNAWIKGQNGVQFLLYKYQFRRLISRQYFHICPMSAVTYSIIAHWGIGSVVTKLPR